MIKIQKAVAIMALAAFALAGCQSYQDNKAFVRLGVVTAVQEVIKKNPEYGPRIKEIAEQVILVTKDGEAVNTVSALMVFIRAEIKWEKLDTPAKRELVETGLLLLQERLEAKLGSGVLPSSKLLYVNEVAQWIAYAATPVTTPQ